VEQYLAIYPPHHIGVVGTPPPAAGMASMHFLCYQTIAAEGGVPAYPLRPGADRFGR